MLCIIFSTHISDVKNLHQKKSYKASNSEAVSIKQATEGL